MVDQPGRVTLQRRIGHHQVNRPFVIACQPEDVVAEDARRGTREQLCHHRLGVTGVLQPVALRRLVERHAQRHVAGRGDCGLGPERLGDLARQPVGAAMAAKQRHHHGTIVGHRKQGRFAGLVGEQRRDGTDQDARRADADHRGSGGEQVAHMGERVGKKRLRHIHPPLAAMNGCAEGCGNAMGGALTGAVQRDYDGGLSQGSAPFVTRIIEK